MLGPSPSMTTSKNGTRGLSAPRPALGTWRGLADADGRAGGGADAAVHIGRDAHVMAGGGGRFGQAAREGRGGDGGEKGEGDDELAHLSSPWGVRLLPAAAPDPVSLLCGEFR